MYTSLAASATGKLISVAINAIDKMYDLIKKTPNEMKSIVFYRSLYRCLIIEYPHKTSKVLEKLYNVLIELPFTMVLPTIPFTFNILLNYDKHWKITIKYLLKIIQHEQFSTIYDDYLIYQQQYFKACVESVQGISSQSIIKPPKQVQLKHTNCLNCSKQNITVFMLRCPGCLQQYMCEECCENKHTLECIRKWKSWKIAPNGMSSISTKGLLKYIELLKKMKKDEHILNQIEHQQNALFTAVETLPIETISEAYENIIKTIIDIHKNVVEQISIDGLRITREKTEKKEIIVPALALNQNKSEMKDNKEDEKPIEEESGKKEENTEKIKTEEKEETIQNRLKLRTMSITFISNEIIKMLKYYREKGFVMCNSKELVLYMLNTASQLSDGIFLEIMKNVQKEIIETIRSDDVNVRECIISILLKAQVLSPIQ